jgi:7-carboxy-7-deazaguanine synthase
MLYINEIFYTIQGESSKAGRPCIFIRFAGCDLDCSYCDTKYASRKKNGRRMTADKIITLVKKFPCRYICITGGEPLLQKNIHKLVTCLLNKNYYISVETNGCRDISQLDPRVHIVMDIKCPGSNQSRNNLFQNIYFLKPSDEIKFVITGRNDYRWAKELIKEKKLSRYCSNILFSSACGKLNPKTLATWILKDGLNVKLQVQLHKLIGLK